MSETKRVCCLYRVSTKGQVEHDDIPMQKQACQEFCERNGWEIVNEFSEKGVSGFKVSAKDRDAIQEIRAEATKGSFDILLVFMFDRLGRKDDETPFMVEWFTQQNIEVWSVMEGQQRFDSHVDKLMNYLRFWQANGESVKTSMRTKTRLAQIVQEGKFRGGVAPYGYRLEKQGRLGKKNKEMYEIVIDETEAELVKLVFEKYVYEGFGAQRLNRFLHEQGYRNRKGTNFTNTTLNKMLKNITYIGILRSGETQSEIFPHLQIIEPDLFAQVQDIMEKRTHKTTGVPLNSKGEALLSGLIHCGHCGSKLVLTSNTDKRNEKEPIRKLRYVCHHRIRHPQDCDGQGGYSISIIDPMIDDMISQMFSNVLHGSRNDLLAEQRKREMKTRKTALRGVEKQLAAKEKELESYKGEIYKSLQGEGKFPADVLSELLERSKQSVAELNTQVEEIRTALADLEGEAKAIQKTCDEMITWGKIYKTAKAERKKMILHQLIERIDIRTGYEIEVAFRIGYAHYQEQFASANTSATTAADALQSA